MHLSVRLNRDAHYFFPVECKDCMNSTSYEYKKMSARRGGGGQSSYPLECRLSVGRLFPQKKHGNIVNEQEELEHLDDIIFRVLVFRIRVLLHKICFFLP